MPTPYKILFVMSSFHVGGAEKQWAQYLSVPPNDNHTIEIITLLPPESASVEKSFRDLNITIHHVDNPSMSKVRFLFELYKTIKKAKPDIVHTVLEGSTGTWGRLTAWLARVPYIVHSDRCLTATGDNIHTKLRPFLDKRTHLFTPNAFAIGEWLEKTKQISTGDIAVIPNVTDVNGRFNPQNISSLRNEWGINSDEIVAGYIAAFRQEKRIDMLLDAMLKVPEAQRPDWLVLGGDGEKMPLVKEKIAADSWLQTHCKLLGIVEDTPAFYASIDYLILTSEREGTPNVVLEAQSMEIPVVGTNVSDVERMLEGSGIATEVNNPQSIAEGIASMNTLSTSERKVLGKYGRDKVVARHELHNAAKVFWDAHLNLLNR